MPAMELLWSCRSDVGVVPSVNEDSHAADAARGLFVVADGLGGHVGGAEASRLAVGAFTRIMSTPPGRPGAPQLFLPPADLGEDGQRLYLAARMSNRVVHEASLSNPKLTGMGSTLVSLWLREGLAHVVHVGDSRCYRLRGAQLEQLTVDHSLVNEMIRDGALDPADAFGHPDRNVLTCALGADPDVDPEVQVSEAFASDLYLLCSDGLSDVVPEAALQELLAPLGGEGEGRAAISEALERCADELVRVANSQGGHDNVTVILVKVCGEVR
jgi:protein phosphatase